MNEDSDETLPCLSMMSCTYTTRGPDSYRILVSADAIGGIGNSLSGETAGSGSKSDTFSYQDNLDDVLNDDEDWKLPDSDTEVDDLDMVVPIHSNIPVNNDAISDTLKQVSAGEGEQSEDTCTKLKNSLIEYIRGIHML